MSTTKTTPRKPKLNVRLLRRVKKHILAEPRRLQMETLIEKGRPNTRFVIGGENRHAQLFPPCGTAACIAGWTCLLSGVSDKHLCSTKAISFLHLKDDNLFFAPEWPEPFRSRYLNAKRAGTRVRVAAARIEYLIKTGE